MHVIRVPSGRTRVNHTESMWVCGPRVDALINRRECKARAGVGDSTAFSGNITVRGGNLNRKGDR
jgi:hypothetical protein